MAPSGLKHSMRLGVCSVCGPDPEVHADGKCAVGSRARQKAWRAANQTPEWRRRQGLKHKYGMTREQYDALLEEQLGLCAICYMPPGNREFDVDHDHRCCPGIRSCGKCVRGLLCSPCNRAVGYFRDDPVLMRRAINYLENA